MPLDPELPQWGDSAYLSVQLTGRLRLADALSQLYVLLPVLDDTKHYRHGGFGERPGETDRKQFRHRAPGRLNQGFTHVRPSPPDSRMPPRDREADASRRSSPRLLPPDGTRAASASSPGFAPRSYPRRTPGRRRANAHWPGYCASGLNRTSSSASLLNSCTLTSHPAIRGFEHDLRVLAGPGNLSPQLRRAVGDPRGLQPPALWCHPDQHAAPPVQVHAHNLRAVIRSVGLPSS